MKLIISDKEKLFNKDNIYIGSWCIKNNLLFNKNYSKFNILQYHWDNKKKLIKI